MTDTKPTGGQAFPAAWVDGNPPMPGMTLRDWFASQALANAYTSSDNDPTRVAQWAYEIADIMLGMRE